MKEPLGPPIESFRCQFWRLYGVMLLWAIACYIMIFSVLFLVVKVDLRMDPLQAAGMALSFSIAMTLVLLAPCVFLLIYLMQVRVSAEGLKSGDMFGRPLSVTWGTITTVRPINFVGFNYLRVASSTSRRVMWLPVFIVDYKRFAGLVREFAGPNHPLTVAVAERLRDGP